MNKRLKMLVMIAVAGSVLGTASLAEAGKIRSTVERRQSPGKGFWDTSHRSVTRQQRSSHFHWNPFRFLHQHKRYQPATKNSQKSWGWQRSSRAELHHPGPRKSRGR
jgi:hypothetical protein